MEIVVLRISHRIERDKRLSTHVALCARAFLADKIFYSGDKDSNMEKSIRKIKDNWGGSFSIEYIENAEEFLKKMKDKGYFIIMLSMYGKNILEKIREIKEKKKILVIVGGEKVDGFAYELCNENLSVTKQPHSEVSALAVFLHELNNGKELNY